MSGIDYKKVIEVFFEGSVDLLSWDEFWEFMDKRKIDGEDYVGEKIEGFPFRDILNCNPSGDFLCKLSDPVKTWRVGDYKVAQIIKRPIQKLVNEYGPYLYGNTVEIEPMGERKARFVATFAGCEVEGIIQPISALQSLFNREAMFTAEKIPSHYALRTNDGIVFQGTPVGVILYDRRPKRSYQESLEEIYKYYS